MKTELETKTTEQIFKEIRLTAPIPVEIALPCYLADKRWVSLESHEAAMKEAEEIKKLAIENSLRIGRENAEEKFVARDAKIREVLELALLISANTTSWTKLQEKIQEALLLLEKEGVNSEK